MLHAEMEHHCVAHGMWTAKLWLDQRRPSESDDASAPTDHLVTAARGGKPSSASHDRPGCFLQVTHQIGLVRLDGLVVRIPILDCEDLHMDLVEHAHHGVLSVGSAVNLGPSPR